MVVHVLIKGLVQGVFFRAFIKKNADNLHITGWVKNTFEGNVEAVFMGEKEKVEKIIELCRQGPPLAEVTDLIVTPEKGSEIYTDFTIQRLIFLHTTYCSILFLTI